MAEPRAHLFDRSLVGGSRRMFCGQRDPVIWTDDPGEVSCQGCLRVLEADSLSVEGALMRKAKGVARHKAVNLLIERHQAEFNRLRDEAYPMCLADQQALTIDGQ